MPIPGDATPPFADVLAGLISGIQAELADLPAPGPTIQVTEATPRPVGLSNLVGLDNPGGLQFAVIKGGRLEVGLRLDVSGADAASADAALLAAHSTLLDRRPRLRARGFLRFEPGALTPAEDLGEGSFRRTGSYRALYEYRYRDVDGAASLIVRIPVDSDLEETGGPGHEAWVASGALVRWDREGQPVLRLRGPGRLQRLSVLEFSPGAPPPVSVTFTRTFTGAAGAPAAVASLAELADNPHSTLTFPTLADFLTGFDPAVEEVELGDWDLDDIADRYAIRTRAISPEIALPRSIDRLEISAQPAAGWSGHPAVLYLRAQGV